MAGMDVKRIYTSLWPEGVGLAAVLGANVAAAAQDAKSTDEGWMAEKFQNGVTLAALLGGSYMIAANRAPQWGTGILYGGLSIVGTTVARKVYDWINKDTETQGQGVLSLVNTHKVHRLAPASRAISSSVGQRIRVSSNKVAGTRVILPSTVETGGASRGSL